MLSIKSSFKHARLVAVFAAALLAGCGKDSEQAKHIPQEATAVGIVSTSSIGSKIAFDRLGQFDILELLDLADRPGRPAPVPGSDEDKLRKMLKDPGKLGLSLLDDIYFFSGPVKNNTPDLVGAVLQLNSASDLEETLNNDPPSFLAGNTQQGKGFSFRILQQGRAGLAWTDEILLAIASPSGATNIAEELERLINLEESASINAQEAFKEMYESKQDLSLYFNVKDLLIAMPRDLLPAYAQSHGADFLTATLAFNKGHLLAETNVYLASNKRQEIEELYSDVALNDVIDLMDPSSAIGYANIHYSREWLKEATMNSEYASLVKVWTTGTQFSEDDFFSLFKGNLMLACTGTGKAMEEVITYEMDENYEMTPKTVMQEVESPLFAIAFDTQPDKMREFLLRLSKSNVVTPNGDKFSITAPQLQGKGWEIAISDNRMLLTNDQRMFLGGISYGGEMADLAKSAPISAYLNIQNALAAFPALAFADQNGIAKHFRAVRISSEKTGKTTLTHTLWLDIMDQERNAIGVFLDIKNPPKEEEIQ